MKKISSLIMNVGIGLILVATAIIAVKLIFRVATIVFHSLWTMLLFGALFVIFGSYFGK